MRRRWEKKLKANEQRSGNVDQVQLMEVTAQRGRDVRPGEEGRRKAHVLSCLLLLRWHNVGSCC